VRKNVRLRRLIDCVRIFNRRNCIAYRTRIAILDLPVRSVGIGNQYGKVQN